MRIYLAKVKNDNGSYCNYVIRAESMERAMIILKNDYSQIPDPENIGLIMEDTDLKTCIFNIGRKIESELTDLKLTVVNGIDSAIRVSPDPVTGVNSNDLEHLRNHVDKMNQIIANVNECYDVFLGIAEHRDELLG